MSIRWSIVLILTVALTVALAQPSEAQSRAGAEKRLEEGSLLDLAASESPLSSLLEAIHARTGNKVSVRGDFGREDTKALSRRYTLRVRQMPFWEVILKLQEMTGLSFEKVDEGKLVLASEVFMKPQGEPNGSPVVAGAFLLRPWTTAFGRGAIRIRPEPWMRNCYTTDYGARIVFSDSDTDPVEFEPTFPVQDAAGQYSGEIELEIDPSRRRDIPATASELHLEATVVVPVKTEPVTTPRLDKLLPKPKEIGDARLLLQRFEIAETERGRVLEAEFSMGGKPPRSRDLTIRTSGGKELQPRSVTGGGGSWTARFAAEEIDSLRGLELEIHRPEYRTAVLDSVKSLEEGAALDVGPFQIRITRVRRRGSSVSLTFDAPRDVFTTESVFLRGNGDERITPGAVSTSGRKDSERIQAHFMPDAPGDTDVEIADCRLVLEYPTEGKRHLVAKPLSRLPEAYEDKGLRVLPLGIELHEGDDEPRRSSLGFRLSGPKVEASNVELLDARGQPVTNLGWSYSGSPARALLTIYVEDDELAENLGKCRLRLQVPVETVEHRIEAKFEDFRLRKG